MTNNAALDRAERVRLLYVQVPTALTGTLAVCLTVVLVLWDTVDHGFLLAWAALVVAVNAYLLGVTVAYNRRVREPREAVRWWTLYGIEAVLHGMAWGGLGVIVYLADSSFYLLFTLAVLMGIAVGSVLTTGSMLSVFAGFVLPTLLPLVAILLAESSDLLFMLGLLLLIFAIIISMAAYNYNRSIRESLRLRFENAELVRDLTQAKQRAEASVEALESEVAERQAVEVKLRQALRELELASSAKSTFLANMSHEFRTPLNAIIGYTELLEEEAKDADHGEMYADLRKVKTAGLHLLNLINEVLDYSKIEAGKMELHVEEVNLREVIDDVVATAVPLLSQKDNRLVLNVQPDLGSVRTDVLKTRQILLNLLSNAAKFSERGIVTVSALQRDGFVEIAVSDTGIGIEPEKQVKVFEAFDQAESSTTRRYGGTGLGLSICRSYCRLMGGDISLHSRVGEGSTFMFTLPIRVVAPPPGKLPPSRADNVITDNRNFGSS